MIGVARLMFAIHKFSHIGHRDENQDRLVVLRSPDDRSRLLVVADGLGGHTGGGLAAQTVVETAERCWEGRSSDQDAEGFLKRLVRESHAAVRQVGREKGLDPHSTVAALLLHGREAISIHAGDSRVTQFSDKEFVERTLDHSVAQLHVLRGIISDEEMATHPDQKYLLSQVGGPAAPDAELKHWDLSKGRRFVVCSDGFWEIFPPKEILELFGSNNPEAEMAQRFQGKLKDMEHHDNTTAILAEIASSRRSRGENS